MYLKHFLWLLALLVFVLPSCKKDLLNEKPILDYQVNFHKRQKSALQEMFFSKGRIESLNPNIHEGLEKRSNADLEPVLHALLDLDEEQHFIPALIHDLGLPLWNSYYKFTGGSGGEILYFIPMAFDHSSASTGYIMAFEASDGEVEIDIVSREFVEALLSDDTAVDSYVNMAGSVLMTLIYDDQLFANPDTAYLRWLWDHYEDLSQDSTGAFLEERGVCTITICYHVISVSGYQSPTTGNSYPDYGDFGISQNADHHCYDIHICLFDTNFSGWDPSDNPWNSGSNSGGSGGDSPGQDYQEFQETCFLYNLTETEPDIQVNIPGGYNESMSATCNLFENIKDCFDEMGFTGQGSTQLLHWLTSHPDGIDLMAHLNFRKGGGSCEVFSEMPWLRSYADLLKEEGEVMDMRAYNMLYNKVYNDLIPLLELDPVVDGAWLMEHPEVVAEIDAFLNNQNYTNANAKKVIGRSYFLLRSENDADLNETIDALNVGGIPSGDIVWEIVKTQLADVLQDIIIELVPGGSFITIGPELLDNIRTGNWLDAMYNALDIALEEAETFIPAAKVASTTLAMVGHYKDIKKLYKAFDKAKNVGVEFVVQFYTYMINKWTPKQIREKFKWLGGSNGAILEGEGANLIKDDLLNIFGGFIMPFLYRGHAVYKLNISPPGFPNKRVYMQLYPDSNYGTAWNIGFYSGKENALNENDVTFNSPLFKIRFDNF